MRPPSHHDANLGAVRTTVNLDADVAAAVQRLRRERSLGLSAAVNELVRAGLRTHGRAAGEPRPFRQRSHDLGPGIDVTNVAEAIEQLEGPGHR
jgi:hypothetical protein